MRIAKNGLFPSNLQVSNWRVKPLSSLSWRCFCPVALRPAFMYTPKILSEKHPERGNYTSHANDLSLLIYCLATGMFTVQQIVYLHPASFTKWSPGKAWNSSFKELGGDAAPYSLLKLFWLFKGIFWKFWGLCWFESCYREALHRHCDAFSCFPPVRFVM